MTAQFTSCQDPVSTTHRQQCGLFTGPDTFPAAEAQISGNAYPFPVRRNGLIRARPHAFSASDAQLRFHHGIFGGNKADIHDVRPGTPVGAGGDSGPELMVMPDPAFDILLQKSRPAGIFNDPGNPVGKSMGEFQAVGTSVRLGAPAGNDFIGGLGHERYLVLGVTILT